MVDGTTLIGREHRQRRECVGFGGGELRPAEGAKRVPTFGQKEFGLGAAVLPLGDVGGERDGRGAGRLAEQAAPLGEEPIHITAAGEFLGIDDEARGLMGCDDGGDDLAAAKAIARRETFVEVALDARPNGLRFES